MILWLTGSLLLLHGVWRIYRSGDVLAAFAFIISYFAIAMGIRWMLPYLFWQPLYYPLFYPYAVLTGAALISLALRAIRGRMAGNGDILLNTVFISALALHGGLVVYGWWHGWGDVLLAYGTLPPLICCTSYLLYRLLLCLPGAGEGKWPWMGVAMLGFGGASFIMLSSEVILPIYGLLKPILFNQ